MIDADKVMVDKKQEHESARGRTHDADTEDKHRFIYFS